MTGCSTMCLMPSKRWSIFTGINSTVLYYFYCRALGWHCFTTVLLPENITSNVGLKFAGNRRHERE